jgi:hypothetical protein
MIGTINYTFTAEVWQYNPPKGWYFLNLPIDISNEIRQHSRWQEEGWGRMPAIATIGSTEWKTAIWFDTKKSTYLLPLKTEIRKKEGIEVGKLVEVKVVI